MPPLALSEASVEARKQIASIVSATRSPWSTAKDVDAEQASQLEKTLRELEVGLEVRERLVTEAEARIGDRERDLAEAEALVVARQKLIDASRLSTPAKAGLSAEEKAALEQLKSELDRQEESLREQKAAMLEREKFLEDNETRLFEKMMAHQQLETELEQKGEDLASLEKRLRDQGAIPPAPPSARIPGFLDLIAIPHARHAADRCVNRLTGHHLRPALHLNIPLGCRTQLGSRHVGHQSGPVERVDAKITTSNGGRSNHYPKHPKHQRSKRLNKTNEVVEI